MIRMSKFVGTALTLMLMGSAASAQVSVEIQSPLITIGEPPPLVEVEPGIQVVRDFNEEVFFVDGYYWVKRRGRWYRSSQWDGSWVYVDRPYVPRYFWNFRPGYYRHWHPHPGYQPRPRYYQPPRVVTAPPPRVVTPPPPRVVTPPPPRVVTPPPPRVVVRPPAPRVVAPPPRQAPPPPRAVRPPGPPGRHR